jgi:hypothetical protein
MATHVGCVAATAGKNFPFGISTSPREKVSHVDAGLNLLKNAPKISPSKLYLISFDPVRLCGYSWECQSSISTSRTSQDNALVAGRY